MFATTFIESIFHVPPSFHHSLSHINTSHFLMLKISFSVASCSSILRVLKCMLVEL